MISFFRRMFSSKLGAFFAILFVGLIGVSFALLDINAPGNMFQPTGDTVATAAGEEIDDARVQRMMTRALENAREENPGIDMAALIDAGGLDDAIEQAARDVALLGFAEEYGLTVGKRLIDIQISEITAFQGLTGEFDETNFRAVLSQQNITEEELREDLTRQTVTGLILGPVSAAAYVPAPLARPFAQLLTETRIGQIAAIPSTAMPEGDDPTAAELSAYYEENIERYTLPERRAVRYAVFTREGLTVPEPTDEQIREYYRENSEEYGGSESRTLRQIILPDEAAARAFYQEVDGGTSFSAAASERGFSETQTRVADATRETFERQTSEAVAAAAFGADEGDLVEPQRSNLGWHVVQVASIVTRSRTPLASVRGEIVAALREQLGEQALADFYLEIQNGIDDGASFEEVVAGQELESQSTPLLAPNGFAPQNPEFRATPELLPILEAAFTMDEDEDPIVVPLVDDQRYALVDVTRVARSAPQELARIRPLVRQHFLLARGARQARTIADEIAEKVSNGTPLAQAVSEADVDLPAPQNAQASRSQIAQMGTNVPAPLRLLFRMAENTAKLVRLPADQGWFVVVLETIRSNAEAVTDELVERTREQFAQITSDEYAEQFLNALLVDEPLERNEEAIEALANRLTGRTSG